MICVEFGFCFEVGEEISSIVSPLEPEVVFSSTCKAKASQNCKC